METVFITIHDLSLDARIKYCSDSIEDILGYLPHEVTGKSCWDYFHPDEIPFARAIHGRGVDLDKAAVLNYCRVQHKDGSWVGCECVFTVVHDVMVASTSIYRRGPKARKRALEGAGIRRIFSSSPRDPRYHMLSYLSNKFYQEPNPNSLEPRAALFLNRFTRTSTIMYATNGVSTVLGIDPGQLVGKSFYYCIMENCLRDAVKCLESAKANDSIAYLRFWYRNPLQENSRAHSEALSEIDESDEDEDGGVPLRRDLRDSSSVSMADAPTPRANLGSPQTNNGPTENGAAASVPTPDGITAEPAVTARDTLPVDQSTAPTTVPSSTNERTSSGNSTDLGAVGPDAIFDPPVREGSSTSVTPPDGPEGEGLEIEAVVSCTSDGMVVILRQARPLVPNALGATEAPYYANGLFASPWAPEPIMPSSAQQASIGLSAPFPAVPDASEDGFMAAIRDVAVFAWSLTGINGSLAQYSRGSPEGESMPPGGLPIWDPNAPKGEGDMYNGFCGSIHRPIPGMGDPSPAQDDQIGSSDDEVVWKRSSTQPPWRRPQRRGHQDAFGADGSDGVDGENRDGGRKRATKAQDAPGSTTGSGTGSANESASGPGSGSMSS